MPPAHGKGSLPKLHLAMTRAGRCYHRAGCTTLGPARLLITYAVARAHGLTACRICRPLRLLPRPSAEPNAPVPAADGAGPERTPHAE
jgi:hypothetical protein